MADLMNLIERLAPKRGHEDSVFMYCHFCDAQEPSYRDPYTGHEPDCAWVEARRLLRQHKETTA